MTREIERLLNLEPIKDIVAGQSTSTHVTIVEQSKKAIATVEATMEKVFASPIDPRYDEDFEEIRTVCKAYLRKTQDNVDKLSLISEDKETATHYAALAALTKVLFDANMRLLEIYEAKKKYKADDNTNTQQGQTTIGAIQNAIFVGTPGQLKSMIRGDVISTPEPATIEGTLK